MSLETGKKLGFTASVIYLITPIIIGAAYIGFFLILLGSITSAFNGSTFTGAVGNTFFSVIGFTGVIIAMGVLSLIALVLFLVSMYTLAQYYSEPGIFKNALYSVIVGIVGSVTGVVALLAFLVPATVTTSSYSSQYPPVSSVSLLMVVLLAMVVVFFVVGIVSAVLMRRAFTKLADKSGVDHFRTAGLLYLIGIIIPFVAYIGWIFAALGYRKLAPPQQTVGGYAATPHVASSMGPVKQCLHCGAENSVDARFCRVCGSPLS